MSDQLFRMIPKVKRAREYYLYDSKGQRYLDLYLDDGKAICGHRPNGLSNVLKNTISRGLYAPYPSVYEERIEKVLKKNFPAFKKQGIYSRVDSFVKAVGRDPVFNDPAMGDLPGESILWRPYLSPGDTGSLMLIRFPFPGIDAVAVLSKDSDLPPSDFISPVIQAGMIRSWFDLQARLKEIDETAWEALDSTGHWSRRGPYLKPLCNEEDYSDLFRLYLDNGILISPYYDKPSICAVDIKSGTLKKLMKTR